MAWETTRARWRPNDLDDCQDQGWRQWRRTEAPGAGQDQVCTEEAMMHEAAGKLHIIPLDVKEKLLALV